MSDDKQLEGPWEPHLSADFASSVLRRADQVRRKRRRLGRVALGSSLALLLLAVPLARRPAPKAQSRSALATIDQVLAEDDDALLAGTYPIEDSASDPVELFLPDSQALLADAED